jgi:hypothetical protein
VGDLAILSHDSQQARDS